MVTLRTAEEADVPAMLEITNASILQDTALWVSTPFTLNQRLDWFRERRAGGFPVLVAEQAGKIVGFATYGPFRSYEGYARTVENSLYVDPSAQKQGIGRALLEALIAEAAAHRMHVMVAAITAGNAASIRLHEHCGFQTAGILPEVGAKFGNWLDLLLMYRVLGTG